MFQTFVQWNTTQQAVGNNKPILDQTDSCHNWPPDAAIALLSSVYPQNSRLRYCIDRKPVCAVYWYNVMPKAEVKFSVNETMKSIRFHIRANHLGNTKVVIGISYKAQNLS